MDDLLTFSIEPPDTVGPFRLGAPLKDVLPLLYTLPLDRVKVSAWHWKRFQYTLMDSLEISVDASRGDIIAIEVNNQYKGLYAGRIGVGSTIGELYAVEPDLQILDYKVFVGAPEFYVCTDFPGEPEDIAKALAAKITTMRLEIPGWALRD